MLRRTFPLLNNSNSNLLFKTIRLVHHEDWVQNPLYKETIETNLTTLRGCQLKDDKSSLFTEQKLFEKTETLYQELQTLIQEEKTGRVSYKPTKLKFCKLKKTEEEVYKLTNIAGKYQALATETQIKANTKVAAISPEKKLLAQDSVDRWSTITSSIRYSDTIVYTALDTDEIVQGIALVYMKEYRNKKRLYPYSLATSPMNTNILGNEKNMVKGVGSGLLARIAHDILSNTEYDKVMRLRASDSAQDFYKKLKFTDQGNYRDFELDEENVIELSKRLTQLEIE